MENPTAPTEPRDVRVTSWTVIDHYPHFGPIRLPGGRIARTVSLTVEGVLPPDDNRHPQQVLPDFLRILLARQDPEPPEHQG
jgi:hypothetical protein